MTQNSNDSDETNEHISSEPDEPEMSQYDLDQEEKARFLKERGEVKFTRTLGTGPHASILRGIQGESKSDFDKAQGKAIHNAINRTPDRYVIKKPLSKGKRFSQKAHISTFDESPGEILNPIDLTPPTHITKEQLIDLYSGICFANAHGVLLNTHLTISWRHLGFEDHSEATDAMQELFMHHLHGWFKFRITKHPEQFDGLDSHELYWIYSHENSTKTGFHTHFLLAMPNALQAKFHKWVHKRFSAFTRIKPLHENAIKVSINLSSDQVYMQWHFFKYLCKGLDKDARIISEEHKKRLAKEYAEYTERKLKQISDPKYEEIKFPQTYPVDEIAWYVDKLPTTHYNDYLSWVALFYPKIEDHTTVALGDYINIPYENPGHITCKCRINMSDNLSKPARLAKSFTSKMERGQFDVRELYNGSEYLDWHRIRTNQQAAENSFF